MLAIRRNPPPDCSTRNDTVHRPPALRAEEEIILRSIRATRTPADVQRTATLLAEKTIDWALFWEIARQQHVLPAVARAFKHEEFHSVPSDALEIARSWRLQFTLHNMANHSELTRICRLLQEQSIPIVPLKGTYLATRVFGAIDARQCGDIDVLVPELQWQAARQVLIGAGYRPVVSARRPGVQNHAFHGVPLHRTVNGRTFIVELHWKLNDARFVTINYDKFWDRAIPPHSSDDPFWIMPPEELLLFLSLHAAKHHVGLLKLLGDIDHLIAREGDAIDWGRVVSTAHTWRVNHLLYFILQAMVMLFEAPVPRDALAELKPPIWHRGAVRLLISPNAILRPPMPERLRWHRFKLAYCAMLSPVTRGLRAYLYYFMRQTESEDDAGNTASMSHARRIVNGLAWTGYAMGTSIRDR